jgi:hypothetical protein
MYLFPFLCTRIYWLISVGNFIAVWVAAVALFFHRWGKIRMLLPYQPVFKEEEPVIVGLSPSPTPLQLSQPSQLLPSSSLSQSQPPVPPSAVHVSANKFVSLDPAAIRRNQFMVSSSNAPCAFILMHKPLDFCERAYIAPRNQSAVEMGRLQYSAIARIYISRESNIIELAIGLNVYNVWWRTREISISSPVTSLTFFSTSL